MTLKEEMLKYLIMEGPALKDGNRFWNIANRKFLYMTPALAQGFLNLRDHPRYRELVINKEIELLNKNKDKIVSEIEEDSFNLIDMGCADGTKVKVFISLFKDKKRNIRFCPASINQFLIDKTLEAVKAENFSNVKESKGFRECFVSLDKIISEVRGGEYQKSTVLLLGSILASFDINEYLFNVSNAMLPGDRLIIGNGIREGERLVNLETYKSPLFNAWFIHLMKELGFSEDEVEYGVRFNHIRIEMFYKIKKDREFEYGGKKILFRAGDEIMVAKLYKYFKEELEKFCKMYFKDVEVLTDDSGEYAIVLCEK